MYKYLVILKTFNGCIYCYKHFVYDNSGFVKYLCLLSDWLFETAKIYHLKVHISHKKVRQEAKSDHPLFRPANSCGLISFQARTLALLDLSRHATLLRVLLDETISFQDSDCSFLKKKTGFTLLLTAKKCLCCVFLLVIIAVLIA